MLDNYTKWEGGFGAFDMQPPFPAWLSLELYRLAKKAIVYRQSGRHADARRIERQAFHYADVIIQGANPYSLKFGVW